MHKAWRTCQPWFITNSSPDMSALCNRQHNTISLCNTVWVSVCLRVYLQVIFHMNPSIVCMFLSVCVLNCLTRTNGCFPPRSCCIQGVALSAWDSQCDSDLGTATKRGHHTGKMDDFVQPKNMKFSPLYMCTCLRLRKNNIGRTPPSEVNVRAR